MWGQIVTTKIKVLKKFLRLQCYQKPFKNSFSSTSSNFDNNGWWGKLDWKLPDIVTINKSFPAPSSRLSHIWCETSLWSLDKSTELLQVHIVSVNVMSIVQFIGSIANLCIGPRWNGPHLVVGKGQRIHNCLYSVFYVPCLHCVPSHEVILGALVSVPHGDVKLLALVLVQIQLKLLLPLGIQTLIYSFGFVPLICQSVKIPPSSPKI